MKPSEITLMLAAHGAWCRGHGGGKRADLSRADLRDADLSGAILSDAILRGAILRDADLSRADLSDAILRGADLRGADLSDAILRGADLPDGTRWAHIGPVGQGRRTINAWRIGDAPAVIQGGCFSGTFAEFRAKVTADDLPWDWASGTVEQVSRWRAECLAAADLLELAVMAGVQ